MNQKREFVDILNLHTPMHYLKAILNILLKFVNQLSNRKTILDNSIWHKNLI